jgi:hypothetical protein
MIIPPSIVREDAQAIPLLLMEWLGAVDRDAGAGTHHPYPSSALEGSHVHASRETRERPRKDRRTGENAKKMLNLERPKPVGLLESTKVSKNELKTDWFLMQTSPKRSPKRVKTPTSCGNEVLISPAEPGELATD